MKEILRVGGPKKFDSVGGTLQKIGIPEGVVKKLYVRHSPHNFLNGTALKNNRVKMILTMKCMKWLPGTGIISMYAGDTGDSKGCIM